METFEHRGRKVVYDRFGAGPPIVLLHNAGAQRHIWDAQVAALRVTHEVFALDLPGYGESEQPADGYRLADYVRMLDAFLTAHQLTDVVLIGNCLGSATALSYAMRHPELVRALVLISPLTWKTMRAGRSAPLARLDARMPLAPLARRLALPEAMVTRIVGEQLGSRGRRLGLQRTAQVRACWTDRGRLQALDGLVQDFPNFRPLDTFTPPATFPPICTIWGRQNRILSAAAGARLNRSMRPHTSVELADCGHLPMVEDPDRITAIIREFLGAKEIRPYTPHSIEQSG